MEMMPRRRDYPLCQECGLAPVIETGRVCSDCERRAREGRRCACVAKYHARTHDEPGSRCSRPAARGGYCDECGRHRRNARRNAARRARDRRAA